MTADHQPIIEYLPDSSVDVELDRQLRDVLSTSFAGTDWTGPFAAHRYSFEMPQHRWFIRSAPGALAAHVAIHDKTIGSSRGELRIGGVADVCVRPEYRGRGYVRRILQDVHAYLIARGVPFAALFGRTEVYRSSGYVHGTNPLRMYIPKTKTWTVAPHDNFMVKQLGAIPWPNGEIDLRGTEF